MNVVRRITENLHERILRRRIEEPRPQFAVGVAPRPTNPPPRIHPCKKGPTPPHRNKPLITFSPNIPYECMITALMTGVGIKARHEMMEIQRASIETIQPPEMRTALFETLREKEHWLLLESKCRTAFRILVSRWLFKRYSNRMVNTEDPATLSEPVQPIYVFDASARGTYVFEASSLRKSMERDLNYCDWLFPEPFHPKNPLTNLPFHMGHRIYILQQLRAYNQGSWILESYSQVKWNLKVFRDIFMVPLKTRALQDICRNPTSEETIDYMSEFIEDHYDYHEIHRPEILTVLKWAIKHTPTHEYMLEWLDAFKHFYSIQIIYGEHYIENNYTIQTRLYGTTEQLFKQIKTINRLAKLRNEAIQERRRLRAAEGLQPEPVNPRPVEIETVHGPVRIISEFQSIVLPLSNPIIPTQPLQSNQTIVQAQFELGDVAIDVLTERVSHLVDEWNHANS
jgi:hypothetical protein